MTILDVIIGMSALFLVMSVVVSAVNEFIAGLFRFRSNHLRDSLDQMIGEAKRLELYGHPLVQNITPPGKMPAYISSETFADVLTDVYGVSLVAQQGASAIQTRIAEIDAANPLKPALSALWNNAAGDYTKFKQNLSRWFDSAMDRYSGEYKRKMHVVAAMTAIVLTVGLNVSAINVFEKLWKDPTVRAAISSAATASAPVIGPQSAIDSRVAVVDSALSKVSLPIGWPCHDDVDNACAPGNFRIWFGWIITIVAASLGAPFWFDVLNSVANVRSTGPKPAKAEAEKS